MADSDSVGSKSTVALEEQGRDELLQHCKRQLLLLQKTKAKLDEHKKEREHVESQLRIQLDEVTKQRDQLQSKLETSTGQLEQRIQELEAQNASLGDELQQLKVTAAEKQLALNDLSEATNELNLLREEKRGLIDKVDSLEQARDAALEIEKRMVQTLDENRSLTVQLSEALGKLSQQSSSGAPLPDKSLHATVVDEKSSMPKPSDQLPQDDAATSDESSVLLALQEANTKLAQAEQQLKQMEEEKMEWRARETATRCRVEELESSVQVLTADLDNDRQHICTLTEALETAERGETDAKTSLQRLQSGVDDLVSSLTVSCSIIFANSEQQVERFSRLCLDTLLALIELSPPVPSLFDKLSIGLKAISDDFVRCDRRRVEAEQRLREVTIRLDAALDEAEACKAKVDSARSALEAEKRLREELESRSLEASEERDILHSTTTALTNQLEEAQLHLSQLLTAAEDSARTSGLSGDNSTDDDKTDETHTEHQLSLREQLASMQAELVHERSIRESVQRESESRVAELVKAQQALKMTEAMTEKLKSKNDELAKRNLELEEKEDQRVALTHEVSQNKAYTEVLQQQLDEKSALLEKLHQTIDEMVDRANKDVFSHSDDGCSTLCRLLRCLEDLAKNFSKVHEAEERLSSIQESDEISERCIRAILGNLIETVQSHPSRSDSVQSENNLNVVLSASPSVPNANEPSSDDACDLLKAKDLEIQERDDKIVKLKNLLVKMKREHATLKSKSQQPPQNVLVNNIQSLQTEYDKAVDELEAERKLTRDLQKKVTQTVDRVADMELKTSQLEDDKRQLLAKVEQAQQEVQDAVQVKAEAQAQVVVVLSDLDRARTEMDNLRQELSQQIQNVTALQVETSALQQQVDLGRSAINDAKQMDERSRQLEREVREAKERLEEMVTSKAQLELRLAEVEQDAADAEQLRKRCDQLEEAKTELAHEAAVSARRTDESDRKLDEMTALLSAKEEALKVAQLQLADRVHEIHQLQDSLQSQKDAQCRLVRTLEGKAASLKKDYATAKLELDETKKEFEAYKMKVHSMIKIKDRPEKRKDLVDDSIVTSLKLKIDELNQELSVSKAEVEAAHEQLARLQDRHDSLQKEFNQRGQEFKKHLAAALEAKENEVRDEMQCREASRLEEVTARHRDELARKEQAQKTMVEILEDKLVEVRAELESIKETNKHPETADRSPDFQSANDVFLEPVRQPAEGSESTDVVSNARTLPFDVIPTSGFQPLDKLLENQEVPSFETFESVSSRLDEAMKRIDHFTELLNESEVNNLRLSEQVRVLKEEVRRLERNKERAEQFGNLEYLKNVVLKYLTMRSERERLVPVLVTMLKLSPDEKRILQQGEQGWGLLPKFL